MQKAPILTSPTSSRSQALWDGLRVNALVNLIQVLLAISLCIFLPLLSFQSDARPVWQYAAITGILALMWGIARFISQRYGDAVPFGLTFLWMGTTLALAESITIISNATFPRALYVIPPAIAIFHLPRRWSLASTILTVAWIIVSFVSYPNAPKLSSIQGLVLILVVFLSWYGLAYALLQEQQASREAQRLLRELAASNDQLTRYAAEATQHATLRERNRIAREIHDSLGHYLTVVGVQLEKAIMLEPIDSAEAGAAVKVAKQLTDKALIEVRHSVGTLRETDEAFTLRASIQNLIQLTEQGDLTVALNWRGDETGFSQQQLMTLFRAAQEGLTNVQKHANARHVSIDVELDAEAAVLQLQDDGVGFDPATVKTSSYGLQGLRERVELVGGTLALVQPETGGAKFSVRLLKEVVE